MSGAEERERWRELAEAATPGPWEVREGYDPTIVQVGSDWPTGSDEGLGQVYGHPDAEFLAAAREAVPALLADLEAAERQFKRAAAVIGADDRFEAWDSLLARAEKAEAERLEYALDIMQAHEIENRRLRDGIETLADTVDGDEGVAHNYGCEGEPTCLACIVADLRLIASGSDQRLTGGAS